MIIKHIKREKGEITNTKKLVQYITRDFGKNINQENIFCVNCNENSKIACYEILETQNRNTRSKSDKTMHLIVSFKQGELPSMETIKKIEKDICKKIGFENHQRICSLHTDDTDNVHLHMAINKIHPQKYTNHTPYYSDYQCLQIAEFCEKKYNLEHDNHTPKSQQERLSKKASIIEHNAGIESFEGYIKRNCFENIQNAQNWQELHSTLENHNIKIERKGTGIVFKNLNNDLQVKASSIDKNFSLKNLEKKLGKFEEFSNPNFKNNFLNKKGHIEKPYKMKKTNEGKELFEQYSNEKQNIKEHNQTTKLQKKIDNLQKTSQRKIINEEKQQTFQNYALETQFINFVENSTLKMILHWLARDSYKNKMKKLNEKNKNIISYSSSYKTQKKWADWLKEKAEKGDEKALNVLKTRENNGIIGGNFLKIVDVNPKKQLENFQNNFKNFHISKHGTLIVPMGKTNFRTDGEKIQLGFNSTIENWKNVLKNLPNKKIEIHGQPQFIYKIVKIIANHNLPINFNNEQLNHYKNILIERNQNGRNRKQSQHGTGNNRFQSGFTKRNASNDGRIPVRTNAPKGTRNGRNTNGIRYVGTGNINANGNPNRNNTNNNRTNRISQNRELQPNTTQFRQIPPPQFRNGMRTLSQCDVVSFAQGSEMLLPKNVPNHMEHNRTQSNHTMRWEAKSTKLEKQHNQKENIQKSNVNLFDYEQTNSLDNNIKLFTPEELKSAQEYINERNEKRKKGLQDILQHELFKDEFGTYSYKGVRSKNEHNFILLENNKIIKLLPISNENFNILKNKKGLNQVQILFKNNNLNIKFLNNKIKKEIENKNKNKKQRK